MSSASSCKLSLAIACLVLLDGLNEGNLTIGSVMVVQPIFMHFEVHHTSFVHMNSEDINRVAVIGDAIFVFYILERKDVCYGERIKPHITIVFYKCLGVGGDTTAVALCGDGGFRFPHFGDKGFIAKYVAGGLIVEEEQMSKILGGGSNCTETKLGCADLTRGTAFIICSRSNELNSLFL